MGQYYSIFNLTKKEFITPSAYGDGLKLLELNQSLTALAVLLANSNGRGGGDLNVHGSYDVKTREWSYTKEQKLALDKIAIVAGRWAGDKIVIQGDYAERGDPAYIGKARQKTFTCIDEIVRAALETDEYLKSEM